MSYADPASKLLGHLDLLHELKTTGTTSRPVNCEIDLSLRCSLGCVWCAFRHTHVRGPLSSTPRIENAIPGGDLMDVDLAKRIVTQLVEAGVRSISWTGGGEPTLHPAFNEIIEFAGETGIRQGIYTHGGHLNEERAALLKRLFTFVYVSLDAYDRASYLRDKQVDRFDAACEGVRRLVAANGDATIGVGYLVTRENYGHVADAAVVAESLGADYLQVRPTIMFDENNPGEVTEARAWLEHAAIVVAEAAAHHPIIDADLDRFSMYRDWTNHGYETCWWSTMQTCITPNGKVWVCVNKREHATAEIGDLSGESFADIWTRHSTVRVADDCRVMCRGHLANKAIEDVFADRPHPEFV